MAYILPQTTTHCRWACACACTCAWSGWRALTAATPCPQHLGRLLIRLNHDAILFTPTILRHFYAFPSFPSSLLHTPLRLPAFTLSHVLSTSQSHSRPFPLSARLGPIGHAYISTCILPCPYVSIYVQLAMACIYPLESLRFFTAQNSATSFRLVLVWRCAMAATASCCCRRQHLHISTLSFPRISLVLLHHVSTYSSTPFQFNSRQP